MHGKEGLHLTGVQVCGGTCPGSSATAGLHPSTALGAGPKGRWGEGSLDPGPPEKPRGTTAWPNRRCLALPLLSPACTSLLRKTDLGPELPNSKEQEQ